jgi:hypothetical protein
LCYYTVGPAQQVGGFGWGTGLWSGTVAGPATTTLASTINDSVTDIPLTDTSQFPATGEIRIGTEDISYTNNDTTTNILSGGAREVNGTTKAGHSGGVTVTNISEFVAWGEASSADFTIDPGLWVLDNYGTKLIALIYNGRCFEWDAAATNATSTRATTNSKRTNSITTRISIYTGSTLSIFWNRNNCRNTVITRCYVY